MLSSEIMFLKVLEYSTYAIGSNVKTPEIFGKSSPVNYIVKVAQW